MKKDSVRFSKSGQSKNLSLKQVAAFLNDIIAETEERGLDTEEDWRRYLSQDDGGGEVSDTPKHH